MSLLFGRESLTGGISSQSLRRLESRKNLVVILMSLNCLNMYLGKLPETSSALSPGSWYLRSSALMNRACMLGQAFFLLVGKPIIRPGKNFAEHVEGSPLPVSQFGVRCVVFGNFDAQETLPTTLLPLGTK